DLLLMDIQMPELDGYAATMEIRRIEHALGHPRTPICALTADAMGGDRQRCLDAGMDEYLTKPISPPKLLDVVRRAADHRVKIHGPTPPTAPLFAEAG
ncbi:MAG TPA: response regulator, partial [Candidatus Synoicihabitans sp.]|nr:response regulator [Candidatus Synoicihabitans sp.]